ncbi:MAG: hypothetical protein K9M57_11005 [Phycisphaerae bacterium]|nr:hypothetical protein [Phycisphaerae bacterium]
MSHSDILGQNSRHTHGHKTLAKIGRKIKYDSTPKDQRYIQTPATFNFYAKLPMMVTTIIMVGRFVIALTMLTANTMARGFYFQMPPVTNTQNNRLRLITRQKQAK